MAASQSSSFGGRCEGRLRHVAAALGRAPAPVAAADGGSSVFRVLFVGVDHPHGCAWRKSLQEAGRFEIVGLVPGFGGAITSLEEEYIALPRYADADAALAAGLAFDGAVVLLSNREAPPNCVSLASAGKHVVLEKPGVGTVEDAQAILDAADASGAVFTMAYTQRFAPCAVRLAEMAADKQFGKVISLENVSATTDVRLRNPSHYLFDPEENKYPAGEGGYFSWLGCHNLDMVRFVSGQKIVGVTARVGVYGETDSDVEDGGAIIIELADGALVTLIGGCALINLPPSPPPLAHLLSSAPTPHPETRLVLTALPR
jgi:predicted dehydrogenase